MNMCSMPNFLEANPISDYQLNSISQILYKINEKDANIIESNLKSNKIMKKVISPMDLAKYIEHTLVKPEATREKIKLLCDEAKIFKFRAVCVNPIFVRDASHELTNSNCLVVCVVGFPLGTNLTKTKVEEATAAVNNGANEIDMVMSIGALKNNEFDYVYNDINSVVEAVRPVPVKVIIETGLLNNVEKIRACLLSLWAGASFIKTSTGFAYMKTKEGFENRGANEKDVRLIKSIIKDQMEIKASGGIEDFITARALIEAGATRIGSSSSISIVTNASKKSR